MPQRPDPPATPPPATADPAAGNELFARALAAMPSPSGAPTGMSRQELAEAANAELARHGFKGLLTDKDIGRFIRGETRWPRDHYRAALRTVLGINSDRELGFYPNRRVSVVRTLRGHDEAEAQAGMLPDHAYGPFNSDPVPNSFLGASLIGQVGMPPGTLMQRRHGRLTPSSPAHLDEIVVHLREQWHALVRTDNLLGPRFAIAGVLNHIAVIEDLCSGLRGAQRREVVRLGAQYAESAAWLYEDAGNMEQARYWTSRAMELAHEGDDVRMLAWTIFRRSQQAATALEVARAIGLAQAALRNDEQLATPTRAAIRVQEAYCHALDGNEVATHTLLDDAHTWAASDTEGDAHEGHGSYCTPSYIETQRANCWLTTGKPKKAIALYEKALATLPVVYQRSRAAALSRLAVAHLSVGHVEQAADAAHAALPVARSGGSMRIVDEVKEVGRQLTPHRKLQEVAALLDDLGSDAER